MINITVQGFVKWTVIWLLGIVTVLYIVSGFGITQFIVVETITFGLLTKNLAFRIHDALWIPFIVLLILHYPSASFSLEKEKRFPRWFKVV